MNYYKTRFTFDPGRAKVWRAITEYLQPYVGHDKTVLDLGSGYADFINLIKAKKKYAVDINPTGNEFCNKDVTFINKPSTSLSDIPTSSVDVVFSSNLLEHLDNVQLEKTIMGMKKLLKKDGVIILIGPNYRFAYKNYFDDYTHKSVFSDISLVDYLAEYDFKALKIVPKFLPLTLKSRLPKSYFLTKMYISSPIHPMGKQMLLILKA